MDPSDPLRARTITLVGLMGSGKSSVGKRLAQALDLPFRDGERRVIARLLEGPPIVLATGGGAFMKAETRDLIKARSVSVWLKTDLPILARRVARKDNRPLLTGKDPMTVLQEQAEVRYPAYGRADITVETGDSPHQVTVDQVVRALTDWQARASA